MSWWLGPDSNLQEKIGLLGEIRRQKNPNQISPDKNKGKLQGLLRKYK